MNISLPVKEGIARIIGQGFTTSQIVNIFDASDITTRQSLFVKWKIILDAFNQISEDKQFFNIIKEFAHPLNFVDDENRQIFIDELNDVLLYEGIQIKFTGKTIRFITNNKPFSEQTEVKTLTDYIRNARDFFKDEYNKLRMTGLKYEYSIGENPKSEQTNQDISDYNSRLRAVEALKNAGFIIEYKIEERIENFGYYIWDYAICKIDEKQITKKKPPHARDEKVHSLTKKITHEHVHRFENSIQEKEITLKYPKEEPTLSKISLKDRQINFDDDGAKIVIGDKEVSLPPYKNEHYFCRVVFKRKKGEAMDWSTIYQEMEGKSEPNDQEKNKRTVLDTMYALNKRIMEVINTDDAMFVWREKTITRQY